MLREGTFLQDRYEIIGRIGSGGMSEVYKARDIKLNRLVAVKVLKDEFSPDASFVSKFKIEAQSAAGLTHPNVVNVYDVVDYENLHYIVMELVEGITLKEFISKKGNLNNKEALGIAIQIAQGIGAAHGQHIIHRDIKPQNVIISSDGKVKVADFGIARAATSDTLTQAAMGSVQYISPEQAMGNPSDERSDIYSLGITIYEMLTGRTPFRGDTSVSIALAHIEKEMPLAGNINPDVTPDIERIILKCCQKKADHRYQNVQDLIIDLRAALTELNTAETRPIVNTVQHTRVLTPEEVGEINARAKATAVEKKANRDRLNSRDRIITPKKDSKDSSIDKLIAAGGIALAVIVVLVAVFFVGRALGVFDSLKKEENVNELEMSQELSDTQTLCPDVLNLSVELAEQKLSDSSLQIKVKEYQDSDTVEKNIVMSQEPAYGTVVDKYSAVYVILSNGSNSEDLTPYGLVGMLYEDARTLLLDKGFDVRMDETFSNDYETGRVVLVTPINPEKNGTVTLSVSKGAEDQMAKVPSIVGQSEDIAIALLAESNLMPGEVTLAPSDTVPQGCVISQSILPDTEISKGATIAYTVSSGPDVPEVKYAASIQESYSLKGLIGPGSTGTNIQLMIRLHQFVNEEDVYTTLMEPTTISGTSSLPIRYDYIEGAVGVESGEVEIVKVDDGAILKSYPVQFFAQQQ